MVDGDLEQQVFTDDAGLMGLLNWTGIEVDLVRP
jgi:hypothetical protein